MNSDNEMVEILSHKIHEPNEDFEKRLESRLKLIVDGKKSKKDFYSLFTNLNIAIFSFSIIAILTFSFIFMKPNIPKNNDNSEITITEIDSFMNELDGITFEDGELSDI